MSTWIRALAVLVVVVVGCGKHDESLAKRAGNTLGEAATDFASGVGKGVDKQMAVNVELSKSLAEKGLSKTVAKLSGPDLTNASKPLHMRGISVYLIASKPLKSKLIAKALSKEAEEIGRSVVDVDFAADDAKYVDFKFDRQMDSQLVARYVIDLKM
jgi:hypothetical protein